MSVYSVGNSSGVGGCQCQNMLYVVHVFLDQKGSIDVDISTLRVFNLDVYELLDLWDTHSFETPYVTFQLSVILETLSQPFLVSTKVCDPIIARQAYKNFPITISQKVTSA